MSKSGIVNARMVITEEKILSNIDKIQKLINPKSKKQIVELEDDTFFKDLIEAVKSYMVEYPNKKNFPASVYKSAYNLVEYATNQFEENTKEIEDLIRQRENNIGIAANLKEALDLVTTKEEGWEESYSKLSANLPEDIIDTLETISNAEDIETEEYKDAVKVVNAKIVNLESNLHIEIDMERIEDRSKALSYIGIEIADALKLIPTPHDIDSVEEATTTTGTTETISTTNAVNTTKTTENKVGENTAATTTTEVPTNAEYLEETTFEVKPSLWQRIKKSKLGRAIRYVFKARVVLDVPALPEGNEENKQ